MKLYEIKMYLKRLSIVKFILKKKYEKEDALKQCSLQNEGLNVIKNVENALTNFNVDFFADYGTLLGIIRDHAFISWDNDLDYGLLINDSFDWGLFEKHLNGTGFVKVRQFELNGKIKEQTYSDKQLGLTIDFFSHQNCGNSNITYDFYRKENYIYQNEHEFHVRKAELIKISGIKSINFLGTTVHVPQDAEEYLANVYSKNWRVPDPNWVDGAENPHSVFFDTQEIGKGIFYK